MDAMILAAGRGMRLRPLTDKLPKPLVRVGLYRLIEHQLFALADAGFKHIVINTSYLSDLLENTIGNGKQYDTRVDYSRETDAALETGGGVRNALHLLESDPFLVVNGDIMTDYDFASLRQKSRQKQMKPVHIVLVPNPEHNPGGDFAIDDEGNVVPIQPERPSYTYSGIGIYSKNILQDRPVEAFPLAPVIHEAIADELVSGEVYNGNWIDVGNMERLQKARLQFAAPSPVRN